MKYLLLIALVAAVWWAWGKRGRPAAPKAAKAAAPAENMVSCAHCGVNMPESESLREGDLHFCSEAHRQVRGEHGRRP